MLKRTPVIAEERKPRTLWRILAVRIAITSLVISAALITFFFAKYMLDRPALRRATLEARSIAITAAIRAGGDPTADPLYQEFPRNYGFRVFDHRRAQERRIISEINPALLPPWAPGFDSDLIEGFFALDRPPAGPAGPAGNDRWLLTDRDEVDGRFFWVQVVMIGDPDWQWQGVILDELFGHVFVPVISIVPLLTLATLLSIRHALRPLARLGAQAEALGLAATRGRPLPPLPDTGLPLELRELVGAINTMLAALSRVLEAQRDFAADAAHELRTPLAVLALQVAELPGGPVTDQLGRELADLGRLVGQLLRFAQAENAMLSAQAPVDLSRVSRRACAELAQSALVRWQRIDFDAPDAPVMVEGNAELLDVAVRNLVDNALKASPPATTVWVHVGAGASVTVEDCGPGVPDSHKQLIFRRFWRGEGRRATGAGIGLALVRKIAELHGGDVHVEDREQGGSRFILDLTASA